MTVPEPSGRRDEIAPGAENPAGAGVVATMAGRPHAIFDLTVADGVIAEIDVTIDPDRVSEILSATTRHASWSDATGSETGMHVETVSGTYIRSTSGLGSIA